MSIGDCFFSFRDVENGSPCPLPPSTASPFSCRTPYACQSGTPSQSHARIASALLLVWDIAILRHHADVHKPRNSAAPKDSPPPKRSHEYEVTPRIMKAGPYDVMARDAGYGLFQAVAGCPRLGPFCFCYIVWGFQHRAFQPAFSVPWARRGKEK